MNIQDRKKSLTAEELRQRYDLDGLKKDRKAIELNSKDIENVGASLNNFVDVTTQNIQDLQNQVDGNITTWFYSGVPTLSNAPAYEWTTTTEKDKHIGDLYYDQNTGYAYRFQKANNVYSWLKLTDSDVTEALAIANDAKDTADSKRRVFVSQPTPPYDIGDIWIKDDEDLYRCRTATQEGGSYSATHWILATNYTDDTVALQTQQELNAYKTLVSQNYVTNTALETNTQGIYATVSATYETITNVSAVDSDLQQTKTRVTGTENRLSVEEGRTTSVIQQIGDRTGKTTSITQDIASIESQISDIADITTSANAIDGSIEDTELQNIASSYPIRIEVHPLSDNISYLYPDSNLYPEDTLYPTTRYLIFTNTSTNDVFEYELPDDLLYYDANNYDSFVADYEANTCQLIKKCKYNQDGTVGLLPTPVTTNLSFADEIEANFSLTEGNYKVELQGYNNGYIFTRLMVMNAYTAQYATKVELNSSIRQTASDITSTVSANYVGNHEVISKINQTAEQITIDANKVNLNGYVTVTDLAGTSTTINGSNITTGTIDASQVNVTNINASNITSGSISCDKLSGGTINGQTISGGNISGTTITGATLNGSSGNIGGFDINSNNLSKTVSGLYNYDYYDLSKAMQIIMEYVAQTNNELHILDVNNDNVLDSTDFVYIRQIMLGQRTNTKTVSGTFQINSNNPKKCISVLGQDGDVVASMGVGGIDTTYMTCENFVCGKANSAGDNYQQFITGNGSTGVLRCVSLIQSSKEELKKNIEKLDNGLDIIKNIDIYKYNFKTENDTDKKHIGFVIGKDKKYSKEVTNNHNDGADIYSFVSVCCKAIQEQQEIIENLQSRIEKLEGGR